jgi:hypothetical protein
MSIEARFIAVARDNQLHPYERVHTRMGAYSRSTFSGLREGVQVKSEILGCG